MLRWALPFAFLIFAFPLTAQQKTGEIRILNLLPYIVKPPLVEPAIPSDFVLGIKEEDPYFTSGYFWGTQKCLSDYYTNPSALNGCLIRAQVSTQVKQLGVDRFSCDGDTQGLSAAGFTEIKMSRGKWGIFPYRELTAKGSRGRRYYQLWVGLNTSEGATLCFQFLYPEYLNEPTQTQKSLWNHFVRKTKLLSIKDLLVARGAAYPEPDHSTPPQSVSAWVEKRVLDQKMLIRLKEKKTSFPVIDVLSVEELPLLKPPCHHPSQVKIEIELMNMEGDTHRETLITECKVVDQFSFEKGMLYPTRFQEDKKNLLVFHSN